MTRIQSIALALLVGAVAASAQETVPAVETGVNFSAINIHPGGGTSAFTVFGGSGVFVYNFNRRFSGVADLGGYHNVNDKNFNPTTFTYLFGPRINFRHSRVTPYAQTLFGGARVTSGFVDPVTGVATPHAGFAAAIGAGLDVKVREHIVLKPAQLDYFLTRVDNPWSTSTSQNNLRYSAGIAFTFGSR